MLLPHKEQALSKQPLHLNLKFDAIVANPPYAKLLDNGKRSSKNHNLIKDFIEKALLQLKQNGLVQI